MNDRKQYELKEALTHSFLRFKKVIMPFPPSLGIHMGELLFLKEIAEKINGKGVFTCDLHINLFVSKPAVSQMIGALEKKGYISRETCLDDRRKVLLTLTQKGTETVNSMSEHVEKVIDEIISRFGEENTSNLIKLFNDFADISDDLRERIENE